MSDFRAARDFLLHADYDTARSDFRWPEPAEFNWALDWFDGVLAAETPDAIALKIPGKVAYTFAELSVRSNRVANWLHEQGVGAVTGSCSCWATRPSCGSRCWPP